MLRKEVNTMPVAARGSEPLYQGIINDIHAQIRERRLLPGDRVPSIGQIADRYGVSAITAKRAVAELQALKLVRSVQGKGTFVSGGAISAQGGKKVSAAVKGTRLASVALMTNNIDARKHRSFFTQIWGAIEEEAERRRRREKERETAARATSAGGDAAAENEEGSDDEPEDTIEPPPALSAEDADAAIEPADALSAQALATQAEDMAVEDALYALDGALAAGALTSEPYLRAVRRLCSRQYSLRALGAKVAERQHALAAEAAEAGAAAAARAAATNRPSPPPPSSSSAAAAAPGVEMPQGDSWCSSGVLSNPLAATTANRGLGSGRRR